MQKGFASLEIILTVLIVALLAGAALPNALRVLEKVSLDYETKRLYSELRFAQALSRDSNVETKFMGGNFEMETSPGVTVTIDYSNHPNSWQARLGTKSSDPLLREVHVLRHGETFASYDKNNYINFSLNKITFDSTGKHDLNGTWQLTSRTGKYKSKIIFDTVGRILVGTEHD